MIQAVVHGESVQPRAERRLTPERRQLTVRLQKYLLQQLLGVLRGASHPEDQAEEAPCVLTIQLLEGVGIPCAAPRGQLEVCGRHVSCHLRRERSGPALPGRPKPPL